MARQSHTALSAVGPKTNAYSADAANLTMTAADTSNNEQVTHTGKILLFAHNTGASARTITISSLADERGRTGNITTYASAAGEYHVFGPFDLEGWEQTDGKLYFQGSHAEVKFGVVDLSNY